MTSNTSKLYIYDYLWLKDMEVVFTIIPTATYMMELGRMVSKKEMASCYFLVETGSKLRNLFQIRIFVKRLSFESSNLYLLWPYLA